MNRFLRKSGSKAASVLAGLALCGPVFAGGGFYGGSSYYSDYYYRSYGYQNRHHRHHYDRHQYRYRYPYPYRYNYGNALGTGIVLGALLGYAVSSPRIYYIYEPREIVARPTRIKNPPKPLYVARQRPTCLQEREYQTTVRVGGKEVDAYGTACLQADGSWLRGPVKLVPQF